MIPTRDGADYVTADENSRLLYPTIAGIPVLIEKKREPLDENTWREIFLAATK